MYYRSVCHLPGNTVRVFCRTHARIKVMVWRAASDHTFKKELAKETETRDNTAPGGRGEVFQAMWT